MTLALADCTYQIDSLWEDRLRPLLERGSDTEWPGTELVKESTVRTVRRGTCPDGSGYYAKRFRPGRLSDRARDLVGGARARVEFENLQEARRRGLPCPRPLAWGRTDARIGGDSLLLTEAVAGARAMQPGEAAAYEAEVGTLLRSAHDQGLHARDLHPGNLLRDGSGQVWLLDLTSARFANPLEREERARALAFFCLDLDGNLADTLAAPLRRSYGTDAGLVRAAVRAGRRLRNRWLSAFARRATRSCRHTDEQRTTEGMLYLHRPAADLHDAVRNYRPDAAEVIKSGRRGSVRVLGDLVVKERSAADARKLFRAAYLLLAAGVPTPQPAGLYLPISNGHGRGRGLAMSRRLPFPHLLHELEAGEVPEADLQDLARGLGESIGRMHGLGIRSRDLKFENLIRDPKAGELFLVDLDGVRRHDPQDTRGLAADLGRLLAAFRHAPIHARTELPKAFLRGYIHAQKCLRLRPKIQRLSKLSEVRASAWANTHRNTAAASSDSSDAGGTSAAG